MKKVLALLLAAVMLFALCACGTTVQLTPSEETAAPAVVETAAPVVAQPTAAPSATETQLDLIFSNLSQLQLSSGSGDVWCTVTDLDHNGLLELISACYDSTSLVTTARICEVNSGYNGFNEASQTLPSSNSFPDIISQSASCFNDTASGTWYYIFKDVVRNGTSESYTSQCSISLKNSALSVACYGTEKTYVLNGNQVVEYTDAQGNNVSPDEYMALAGSFSSYAASSVNFDWFKAVEASSVSRLTTSYNVFCGNASPTVVTPVATSTPQIVTPYLMITKNPTAEYNHTEGDTVYFVAAADNWDTVYWTFIDTVGNQYNASQVSSIYGVGIDGANGTTLTIYNIPLSLNGWRVFCTFKGNGQMDSTTPVGIGVNAKPVYNSMAGYVTDFLMSSVTITLNNGTQVQVLKDICQVYGGDLNYGCSCTVYYTGYTPSSDSIYSVSIQGEQPQPQYQSAHGTLGERETMSTCPIYIDGCAGDTLWVSLDYIFPQGSDLYAGRGCTVYYYGDDPFSGTVESVFLD